MITIVYKILWTIIMLLFEIYERMYSNLKLCRLKIMNTIYFGNYKYDQLYLKSCQNDLDKIPKHLSIIIGTENIDNRILSNLAIYALISNIKYISYYDIKGKFKLDQIHIPKFVYSKRIQNDRLLLSMAGEKTETNHKNGLEKSIEIINLSPNAGILFAVEICKKLCADKDKSIVQDALKTRQCFSERINDAFQKRLNYLPDPDLAIIFDRTICTYGLLPWQTGFTEFYNIDTKNYVDVQIFSKILYKFAKCEQRFGK